MRIEKDEERERERGKGITNCLYAFSSQQDGVLGG